MLKKILFHIVLLLTLLNVSAQTGAKANSTEFPVEAIFESDFYGIIDLEKYPFPFSDEQVLVKNIIGKNKYWVQIIDVEGFIKKRIDLQPFIEYESLKVEEKQSPLFKYHKKENSIPVKVLMLTEKNAAVQMVLSILLESKVEGNVISGKVNPSKIEELAELPFVQYVSPIFVQPKTLLPNMYTMNRANLAHKITSFGHGFKGKGIKIGVWDGGLINEHVDNTARLINVEKTYYFTEFTRHATHVSGIINGKGHGNLRNVGMAPESFVYGYDFYGDIIKEMRSAVDNFQISITNNSFAFADYGLDCSNSGIYLPEAAELDQMVHDMPELLHVVAVGNAAWNTSTNSFNCGNREWGYVEVGFQGAKNNITVGWLSNVEAIWVGSSRGPTIDGRLKPELVTKGARVNSLNNTHAYANRWGSSQASPAVAGIAALVQESYKEKYGVMPNASLVKAILLNSARDMGEEGPDFRFGFGLVNADRAIENVFNGNILENSVADQGFYNQNIIIPANSEKFQITLCWSDLPAAPPYKNVLVNDLDLKIIGPGGVEYFPWILNPNQPELPAIKGIDTLNNFEQVTIKNPAAGTYTIQVRGTKVASAQQDFSIAYNSDEVYLRLTNPIGGEKLFPGEQVFICWDAEGSHTSFNVQVSYNNGGTWSNLATGLGPNRRYHAWTIPNATRSTQALIRVTSNLLSDVSTSTFVIMPRVGTINRARCDRAVNLTWAALTDATSYIIHLLQNDEYVDVDTVSTNNYTLTGLKNGNHYWVSITAVYDTILAARSNGFNFRPAAISCGFDNDAAITQILNPLSGRKNTSSELTSSEEIQVMLKNFGNNDIIDPKVCYQLNNLDSVCISFVINIAPSTEDVFSLGSVSGLESIGTHKLKVWVKPTDDEPANNVLEATITHLPHEPLTLPYFQDFEVDSSYDLSQTTSVLPILEEYDFEASTIEGRLGIAILNRYASEGFGAVTLDNFIGQNDNINFLTLNLNLDNYQDANIYLDLDFLNHGNISDDNDRLWVRGSDVSPWLEVFSWSQKTTGLGNYANLKAINLTRILKDNGQDYSSSFQLRFGQQGTGQASDIFQVDGITIDNVAVYEAGDDIEMTKLLYPDAACKNSEVALSVELTNHSYVDLFNVPISYEYKNVLYQEVVPTISALSTITFAFNSIPDLSEVGLYELVVYVKNNTDLYAVNDTLRKMVSVSDIVEVLPNYIDFEDAPQFITTGINNSWEWGSPDNNVIQYPAQGQNSWVTGLMKNYVSMQESYLYSPCYDLSNVEDSVQIAFNLILQIEKEYDYLTIEYAEDGLNWNKLGENGSGFNWFNAANNDDIWDVNILNWKVASNYLKKSALINASSVRFRFAISSDLAVTFEGVGLDDWHVTPVTYRIHEAPYRKVVSGVNTGETKHFLFNQEVMASISHNQSGNVNFEVEQVIKSGFYYAQNQYPTLRKSWVVKSNNTPSTKNISLYFTHEEYNNLILQSSVRAPGQLGVLVYKGIHEDTSSINNFWNRNYTYIEPALVKVMPYEKGYLANIQTDLEGEFYVVLNPELTPPSVIQLIDLEISQEECKPLLKATIKNLPAQGTLQLESSLNGLNFTVVSSQSFSDNANSTNFVWEVTDNLANEEGLYYYRFSAIKTDLSVSYLGVDTFTLDCPCPSSTVSIDTSICDNIDSILIGNRYFSVGNYMDTLTNIGGCDSFVTVNVNALNTDDITVNLELCEGDSILVGAKWYFQPGEDTLNLTNISGCDSTVLIVIQALGVDTTTFSFSKCVGDSLLVSGDWLKNPDTYFFNYHKLNGCDSTVRVVIEDVISDTLYSEIGKCPSDSINYNGTWISQPGEYIFTLSPLVNCDSIVVLTVFDFPIYTTELSYNLACEGDSILVLDNWYSQPQQFNVILENVNGCDSVLSIAITLSTTTLPSANFTFETNKLNVQFTNLSTSFNTVFWTFGDGSISEETSPSHTFSEYGMYAVSIVVTGNCGSSDSLTLPLVLDEEIEFIEGISISPNPTSSEVKIRMYIPTMTKVKLRLFNLAGQQLFHEDHSSNLVETTWNLRSLAIGRYFVGIEVLDVNSKLRRYHYPIVIVR